MSARDIAGTLELCRELPRWIAQNLPADAHGHYHAHELDCSFNAAPTFSVDMYGACGAIAGYKCNITLIEGKRHWLVFSPLVVIWQLSRQERRPGIGRAIIDHSVAAIAGFCEAHLHPLPDILIASGNLTTAKAGRPFFDTLGWEIADPRDFNRYAQDELMNSLAFVSGQIDTALAPIRQSAPDTVDPTTFAFLRPHTGAWHAAHRGAAHNSVYGLTARR
jgi:hypothetical protein